MRKQVFGRHLKRDINERKALFKGLMSSLVMYEKIQTTEQKAKAIRAKTDKLVTAAKKGGLQATSLLQPYLTSVAVKKLMTDITPRFADRQGGYTRIIRIGRRFNDDATMVQMEWVELASEMHALHARAVDQNVSSGTIDKKAAKVVAKKTPEKKVIKKVVKPATKK